MPKGRRSVFASPAFVSPSSVSGLFSLGLITLGSVASAQTPASAGAQQPAFPLAGYILEVSGSSARLSLTQDDDIRPGDEFSVLQYGVEIARLRIKSVTRSESLADVLLQQRGTILRRLDTVVPSTAVTKPAQDLQPLEPASPENELKPSLRRSPGSRIRSKRNLGDIISRADWVYPALDTLAREHLLPNTPLRQFHGDQQLTREEIRNLISEAVQNREQTLEDEQGAALPSPAPTGTSATPPVTSTPALPGNSASSNENVPPTPETPSAPAPDAATTPRAAVPAIIPPLHSPSSPSPAPVSTGRPEDRLLYHLAKEYDVETNLPVPKKGFALSRVSRYRLASGSDEVNVGTSGTYQGFMHMGEDRYAVVSLSRGRREWYGDNGYPWLNEAYVNTKWMGVNWQIGQKTVRWGPGYTGSLMLGDAAPALPMVRGYRTFSLGKILGKLDVEQFASRFTEDGDAKYFMARRISRAFGNKFSLGLSETAKSEKLLNPSALILPFQLYQRIFEKDTNNLINIQAGVDAHYRFGKQEVYGEAFIDDITAPKGLGEGRVPRKVGFLAGWRRANLFGQSGTDLRVEWAQTDRNTYLHRNPLISYFDRGLPLGHPMGPNAESLMVRLDRQINPKLELMTAVQVLRQHSTTPPDSASGTAFTLAAAYDFHEDRSLTVKISPNRRVDRYQPASESTFELIADWVF